MKRYVTLEEISDGKLYTSNDMVKADCLGCKGCSKCCHAMGDTILLDPYDIWRFQKGLGKNANELLAEGKIAMRVVDGVILLHIQMAPCGEGEECCPFLDGEGWCTIHAHRPGLCRLFPLGRYYEDDGFKYFLQKSECDHPKAKVKISKWLEEPDLPRHEAFVLTWHGILKEAERLQEESGDDAFARNLNLFLLKTFYLAPYAPQEGFYEQFERRLAAYREIVSA